ncbi:di-trans,poly-cis-decaprenylcistransferase [Candidatus Gottesmanbacteria bacterium]|nr:di-trans,poly-cis-decaprenylcistransferase [Candidatus Gottesmanbacteria bacterium]
MKQLNNTPQHVAIIMDGNRRWARKKNLPVLGGHQYALDHTVEELVETAGGLGIKYITFWAWSTENWGRNQKEVSGIMKLLLYAIKSKVEKFNKKGARLKVIGDISKFSDSIQKGIHESIEKTNQNDKITVIFALNYGGRDEILRAIKKLNAKTPSRWPNGLLEGGGSITEQMFSQLLDTSDIPDPDMIIRTGGEKRLSGFMLWQSEYSELYFTDVLFPDFKKKELKKAVEWFSQRNRRFGK